MRAKLTWCKENADGYGFLFKDMQQLVDKAEEDFQLVVTTRIAEHKQAEETKLEIERERIREEEKASLAASAAITQASAAKPVVMATPPSTPVTVAVSQPEVKVESDFDFMCVALVDHIEAIRAQQKEAA
ncbi:hypothetical protein H0A66_17000 [Alcaligenaceae bacterium]|nr:hypothetical protein [Alcaligenaceae bacterium]